MARKKRLQASNEAFDHICALLQSWIKIVNDFYSLPAEKQTKRKARNSAEKAKSCWDAACGAIIDDLELTRGQRRHGPKRRKIATLLEKYPIPNISKMSPFLTEGYKAHPVEAVLYADGLLLGEKKGV